MQTRFGCCCLFVFFFNLAVGGTLAAAPSRIKSSCPSPARPRTRLQPRTRSFSNKRII